MPNKKHSFYTFFRNSFITGVTVLLPLWGVFFVVKFFVTLVNDALLTPILKLLSPYFSWAGAEVLTLSVKGLLLFVIITLIVLLGALIKNLFVRKIIAIGEGIVMRIPLVNNVYSAIQQISQTFLVNKRAVFSRSVLVEYPRKGMYVLALITARTEGEIQAKTKEDLISVFVPTTPNPTSGFLLFVPQKDIIELDMTIEDSFKLIVSFGAVTPPVKSI